MRPLLCLLLSALISFYVSIAGAEPKTMEELNLMTDQELAAAATAGCARLTEYNKHRVEHGSLPQETRQEFLVQLTDFVSVSRVVRQRHGKNMPAWMEALDQAARGTNKDKCSAGDTAIPPAEPQGQGR